MIDGSRITADSLAADPALATAVVFETTFPVGLDPKNNQLVIHTWGNDECCLAAGSTEAFLYTILPSQVADIPVLKQGDFLLFEEVLGPLTGLAADANPAHRQIVQLDQDPVVDQDPLFSNITVNGVPQPLLPLQTPLPLLKVHWQVLDALTFPLCLSTRPVDAPLIRNVTVARGNIVLADHGLTTSETFTPPAPVSDQPISACRSPKPGHHADAAVAGQL